MANDFVKHECQGQEADVYLQTPPGCPVMVVYDEYVPIKFCPFCGQSLVSKDKGD